MRWQTDPDQPNKFEVISLAICADTVVAVLQYQRRSRSQPEWHAVALNAADGTVHFQHALQDAPLPGGLLVDRHGQVIICMLNGNVVCLGPAAPKPRITADNDR